MSNFIFTNQFYNDDKGRTLPKARLYFYDNNTFNFTDVYSDPELTQVLDNPVTADGAGRFPQIFMDISKTYRVWLKDRNDVQVTPYIDDYTPQTSISDLGTAAFADIKGTVSQSGGVPTGDIIESGSNANGYYTKFADGTLICRKKSQSVASTITGTIPQFLETWPASFIDVNYMVSQMQSTSHGDSKAATTQIGQSSGGRTVSGCYFIGSSRLELVVNYQFDLTAIGRWF